MNVFDYFFNDNFNLKKNFILNENDKISYEDLYSSSLKLANYVRKSIGIKKNVVLVSNNNLFFVTAYLAILKSGNICVPINFNIEQKNLDYIIELTNSELVFASNQVLNKKNFNGVNSIVNENDLEKILDTTSKIVTNVQSDENSLAEIIFTSGSTGEPKGVEISHKNIMANTSSIIKYLNLTKNDIICVVLPFYYCYGLSLLHTHLKVGGSIVLNNTFMFLGTVIKDLSNYNCTGFSGVPSHFQMLLKKSNSFKNTKFPYLKYVTQAGGRLPNSFIEEFVESFPDTKFFVMYGQTEATARLSYLSPDKVISKIGSIGKAIPDVELKIVDKNDNEVRIHEEGELIAKGDNIMKGYYKDSVLTNTILKNNWLYTGDLAKKDERGYIYILARKKEIIKVGGNRVSPKEIEEVVSLVPDIIDCKVIGIDDDIQGEAIKAIVVINDLNEKDLIKKAILEECKAKLAMHKIPQFFEFTDRLNVKSTGKK